MDTHKFCHLGLAVIETEAQAILALADRIDDKFAQACRLLLACQGRIIVTGMGKSGHIAKKIAATLASTGSPAFFVHPGEASHGDMGMITRQDVILAISNSGNTSEILQLIPIIKRFQIPLISLSGQADSPLAKAATVNIDIHVDKEACPLGLAPTSSTTAALVMGDALAIALLEVRGFSAEDFALSHPGGSLGRRLLLQINDIMHAGETLPIVLETETLSNALITITAKKLGLACLVDPQGELTGIFTDGDLRRALSTPIDIHQIQMKDIMNPNPKTLSRDELAVSAVQLMETYKITALVITEGKKPIGVLHLHDLLRAGVI